MTDTPSDHDLLIGHSVKIDTLCELIRAIDKRIVTHTEKLATTCLLTHSKIEDTHREIFDKIDKKTNDATFQWVAGTLIFLMLVFAGLVNTYATSTGMNEKAIAKIEKAMAHYHPIGRRPN